MFVQGNYYWLLSDDEYNFLSEYLDQNPEAESCLGDFTIHTEDGYWVAEAGLIDGDEAEFLGTLGIGTYEEYKKSTDSTNFF